MTKQEYFNLLIDTSKGGGFPASYGGFCRYLTPDGRKCAFGVLIPDDVYQPDMEGQVACQDMISKYHALASAIPDGMTPDDLGQVQREHDFMSWGWDHDRFVTNLLALPCFAGLVLG